MVDQSRSNYVACNRHPEWIGVAQGDANYAAEHSSRNARPRHSNREKIGLPAGCGRTGNESRASPDSERHARSPLFTWIVAELTRVAERRKAHQPERPDRNLRTLDGPDRG